MSNATVTKTQPSNLSADKISHEVNNYLTILYSQMQYIEKKHHLLAVDKDWAMLKQGTKNLSSTLYHLTYPTKKAQKEIFILNHLLEEVYLIWKKRFQKKGYSLHYISEQMDLIRLLGYPSDFVQIMNNLLSNSYDALSALTDPGEVVILLRSHKNQIILQVEDNGCGIYPKDLKHIFDYGISKKQSGHGIGLAIVKELVQKNHGSISVDSTPNHGTTFYLMFSSSK